MPNLIELQIQNLKIEAGDYKISYSLFPYLLKMRANV